MKIETHTETEIDTPVKVETIVKIETHTETEIDTPAKVKTIVKIETHTETEIDTPVKVETIVKIETHTETEIDTPAEVETEKTARKDRNITKNKNPKVMTKTMKAIMIVITPTKMIRTKVTVMRMREHKKTNTKI